MQRRIAFGFLGLLAFLVLPSCGKEDKPVNVAVNVNAASDANATAQPKLSPQDIYDAAIANAFQLLNEKKDDEALAKFEEANAAVPTDFAKSEIDRLKLQKERAAAGEKIAADIQAVLDAGHGPEASKLAADALAHYGDSDCAEKLTALKRQADALAAVQAPDGKQKFLTDAEAAREAKNFRAALIAFDQAAAAGVDVTALKPTYDDLRLKLTQYDDCRNRAAELRKDSSKLEEAVAALEEAKKAWDTPQIAQDLQDTQLAITNRRDRIAIADFEVIGDVGIPLAGRTIAEEMLPNFKPKYDVVEHSEVAQIAEDLKVDPAELHSNEKGRSELGRLAKARFMVVGSVSQLGGISVNARLVDSETGLVVQTAKIVIATPEELAAKLPELAKVLQMTDDQKAAHEKELAQAASVPVAQPLAELPAIPPAQSPAPDVAPPAPIVTNTPKPPEVGQVAAADFTAIPQAPPPLQPQQAVVIADGSPWRDRAFFVAIEVGDNLYRWGRFFEAKRHYEFALSLQPGRPEVMERINNCIPFLQMQPVVFQPQRPRMAVLPFVEMGVPYGMGCWTAESIAPYFYQVYDIVDTGAAYWWMARLGLTYRDVLVDPSARLLLARALGVRYLLFGNLRDNMGIDASTQIVDAEFNCLAASAQMHVNTPYELRLRLGELARLTMMLPDERVVYFRERQACDQQMAAAQVSISAGNFTLAISSYETILVAQPNNVQVRIELFNLRRRHHRHQLEVVQVQLVQQQQVVYVQQQQLQVQVQQQASISISLSINVNILVQQQNQVQVQLLTQARAASASNNFSVSINIYESIPPAQRTTIVINELAIVRVKSAQAQQVRLAQQQAAQQAQLRIQSQQAAQTVIAAQQQQLQAQAAALNAVNARNQAAYNQLIVQAQQAKAKQQFTVELSSYQTARTLQPSPQIEQLVAQAQADVAMANAAKKGPAEQQKVQRNLAAAQSNRAKAEQKSAVNAQEYGRLIQAAQGKMHQKEYYEGRNNFQMAAKFKVTQETTDGIRWANDEIAKQNLAKKQAEKEQQDKQKQQAEFAKLMSEGNAALNAKQFDPAIQKLQAAVNLQSTSQEAQVALAKAKQGKEEQAAQAHKQQLQAAASKPPASTPPAGNPAFAQAVAQARTAIAAKQFDVARTHIGEAMRIDSKNPENHKIQQELADAEKAHAAAPKPPAGDTQKEKFQALLTSAHNAVAAKQIDKAEQSLAEARAINPSDPQVVQVQHEIESAKEASAKKDTSPAKTDANQADYEKYMGGARTTFGQKKYDLAIRYAAEAMKYKSGDPEATKIISDSHAALEAGKKDPVAATPPKTDANQVEYEKYMGGARTTFGQKNYELAIRYATEALKYKPADAEATKIINDSHAAQTPPKKEAPVADANQVEYEKYMGGARTTFGQKNYELAIRYATEALKFKPADPEATKIVNDSHAAQTPPKKETPVATPPKTDPNQAEYEKYIGGARTTFGQKNYELAIRYATEALKYKPADPEATKIINDSHAAQTPPKTDPNQADYEKYMGGARTTFGQKNYELAIRYATEALKFKPVDPEATKIINDSHAAQTPPKKETPVVAPPKADPNQADYDKYMGGARATFGQKNYELAIRYAAEALKYKPADPEATKIVNDSNAALAAAKKPPVVAPPTPPKPDPAAQINNLMQTAASQESQAKYSDAANTYHEVLRLNPSRPEAKQKVDFATNMANGMRQLSAGQFAAASASFDQALRLYPNDANAKHYQQLAKDKKKQ